MKLKKYIKKMSESPCSKCGCIVACSNKVRRSPRLDEIRDLVFPNAEYDYHNCPLWIALNAPEMVEVEDED